MARHMIFIYKVPTSSQRLVFVYSSNQLIYPDDLPEKLDDIIEKYELAIHYLTTDDLTIASIKDKDPFFEGIEFYTDLGLFIDKLDGLISQATISPLAFSKLLLSKFKLDKLEIQKVLYLIYAECLQNGVKLFNESPVAYLYGPVFEDVYQEYKSQARGAKIEVDLSYEDLILLPKTVYTPEVRKTTERIIDAIATKTGGALIDITHAPDGPWDMVYEEGCNREIPDSLILACNDKVTALLYN
ncbi:hypothetical protein AWM75_07940 [Aerococcus urinaehominis]|uniref:Uncharacterized protein n=1 Tax=Aerococcus urinaehominis TaxID=128944 RepID=A0A0X8FM83_9LACT|nr:type II toxin-antitoxin system antitoxin SocA domain-containing protein [Aerococcus urinaehominis]AMB99903.1 hypothetical protein AWM75_07940 [Aerococcus urinaehominis]SDM52393.1 Uncharacterized phage-associated protein [Aerococcus urinaehominis]